jgi:hypothetical protein
VDKDGKLGFPTSVEDIRKFGANARRVFLRKPPSQLQRSFAQVVQMPREEDRLSNQPWKKRGEIERGGVNDRFQEDREPRAKRQQGAGGQSLGAGGCNSGWDDRGGNPRYQDQRQRHRMEDFRGTNRQGQEPLYQGGGGDLRRFVGRQNDQHATRQVGTGTAPVELCDRLNLAKDKKAVDDKGEEDMKKFKCFRCQEFGHHQKDCVNTPICYKCKEEEHMAVECVDFHSKAGELKMYGFALPDQGFYSIKIPGGEVQKASSIIQVL